MERGEHTQQPAATGTYAFADVEIDASAHRLSRAGREIAIEPKAFAVLLEFLAHPDQLLTRDQLLDAIWGHTYVTPATLNRLIAQLRKALADDSEDPRCIQTVHGLGYRFIAPLKRSAAEVSPSLRFAPPARARIPERTDPLLGRESDIQALKQLLGSHRLVTIAGPGGIGKTQAALETARSVATDFPDGVWLLDCTTQTDGDAMVHWLAGMFDIRSAADTADLIARLGALLQARRALLLFDNCERIAEALASNHVVVAPRTRVPISGDGFAGWWQIDKTTGETLGIGDSGWGQGIAGYVVLALTLVSAFVNGWLYCELQPPNGSSTVVADAAFGHANRGRFRHLIDPAVDASSVDCIGQALISLFLGAANAAYEANLGGIRGPTGGGAPENDGEGPGGSLPNDPAGSDGPAGPTSGQGGQPGQGGQGGSAPNGTAGAGGGGAPGGNAGGGSGGGGDAPAPEGNPAGGKWTRQQLMDYYTNRRASTDPSIDGKSRWTNEYVMRQPDASDFVRDNLAQGLGYPTGSGNQPDPPGFSGWLDRYASGGIGAADEGNTYANGMPPKTVIGDPSAGVDQLGKTQPDIPTAGGSGGGSTSGSSSGSGGASGSGSGSESGGGSGTLPGLGPSTPRTPTSPGIGPCVSPCGPDGSTTLVGLGGAMNALGGG